MITARFQTRKKRTDCSWRSAKRIVRLDSVKDSKDERSSLKKYFERSPDLYCEIDKSGQLRYVNAAWANKLGYKYEEIIGRNFVEFLHPADIEPSHDIFSDQESEDRGFFRNRYRHKDGSFIPLLWSGNFDPEDGTTYGHARDVRSDVRRALILSHVAAIQNTFMNSGTSEIDLFNQVLKEIVSATESDAGFIAEIRSEPSTKTRVRALYAATPGFETRNLAFWGESETSEFSAAVTIPLIYLGEEIGVFGVAKRIGKYEPQFEIRMKLLIDATASIVGLYQVSLRENALRERFMVIVEHLPMMLTEFDVNGRITWANRNYREKMGIDEDEFDTDKVLAKSLSEAKEIKRATEFMLSGRTDWQDFELKSADGHFFPSTWTNVRLKDGRAIGIGQDLTDRRSAEAKMIQSSKMASLGEMSAGVSHEINNPLAIIQGSAFRAIQNLALGPSKGDEVEGDLNRIIQNCDRIARIVRGLRAFSRSVDHEPFIPTPLETVVDDVLNLAHERFKSKGIVLEVDLRAHDIIDCRPVQLGQVLMNLLNNAYDAVSEQNERNRRISIKSRSLGDSVEISVEDSGPGIPLEVQNRILEPFFTTKEIGKGTGLGLSISKGIIESHRGRLSFKSVAGRTSFVIELPIIQETDDGI